MRSLRDIKVGVSTVKKEAIQKQPEKVEIKLTHKSKELIKVSVSKRKEISVLDVELDSKKKEAQTAGEEIIQEAKTRAKVIISNASQATDKAKNLRSKAENILQKAQALSVEAHKGLQDNEIREKGIKIKEDHLVTLQARIEASERVRTMAVQESQNILYELTGLFTAVLQRLHSLETLEDTDLSTITDTLATIFSVLEERKLKQDTRDEYFKEKEKQLEEKRATMKEERVQLRMATKEYGKRSI